MAGQRCCLHCRCSKVAEDVPNGEPDAVPQPRVQGVLQIRTGIAMELSPVPLHGWLAAAFLMVRRKGVYGLRFVRDLGITQMSDRFMPTGCASP